MGDLAIFCRASLDVVHGVKISSRKREKRRDFDPSIMGALENQLMELSAKKALLEAQQRVGRE